ncbi:DUF4232 domain-containing protein [Nocardia sp. alder85J]|uniref:DUF4232 domain-containing protein n=1 Tax=Nocardia sp. alder85J TaxID=2862949 RepID=UPI001CD7F409|nr:DUF4232 domain-containing protein [Nocardia sp. alder85J]MCX4091876.1 DUF4232 domain-containing protein [Nocardia sp. alder85J]
MNVHLVRSVAAAALLPILAAAALACSGAPDAESESRCHTGELSAAVATSTSTGRTNALLVTVRNIGVRDCVATGFADVELSELPQVAIGRATMTPRPVPLSPGGAAEFVVRVEYSGDLVVGCPQPGAARVTLPGETTPLTAPVADGGGPADELHVCRGDRLVVQPLTRPAYTAGTGTDPAAVLPHCRADDFAAQAFHSMSGDGAGHRGVEVWLLNRSDQECAVHGPLRVRPDDGHSAAGPDCPACQPTPDAALVVPAGAVLAAGGRTVAGIGTESACGKEEPVRAVAVVVYLPGDPAPVSGPFGGALYCHGSLQLSGFGPL